MKTRRNERVPDLIVSSFGNGGHGVEDDDAGGDEEERVGDPSQKRHEFVHKMLRFQGDSRLGVTHVQPWMECKMKRP